jgi:hypothetical protein
MLLTSGMKHGPAAKKFGVPKTTLLDRIHKRVSDDCSKSGPNPYLTKAEEESLISFIARSGSIGYPLDKTDVKKSVKLVLDDDGRATPFKNNLPGTLQYCLVI